ncbi:MAG: SRPBCC family protein [Bacteroidales bacterium]|nr:SRPBCC family protein [Bacteroidales bacterium]MCF8456638.1 SRPBCC family protein [Bacteroidales bacterium]
MKALKIIVLALVIIVGLILAVAAFLPKTVEMGNSIEISASESVVFNQVNNFPNWEKWSPFKSDDMTTEYEGPTAGVGAKRTWTSEKMGSGSQIIDESTPFSSIETSLDFGADGKSTSTWTFEKMDVGVKVTWGMTMIDLSWPMGRIFGLMAPGWMDPFFTKGLQSLKDTCEAMPDYSGINEIVTTPATTYAINDSCLLADMEMKMGEVYGKLVQFFMKNQLEMAGPPLCIYHVWNPEGFIHFEAAIPTMQTIGDQGEIVVSGISESKAVEYLYVGSYDGLGTGHELLGNYISDCGYQMAGSPYEEYLTDPSNEPDPAKWQTRIVYPIQ